MLQLRYTLRHAPSASVDTRAGVWGAIVCPQQILGMQKEWVPDVADRGCVMTSVNGAFDSHIPSKLSRQKRSRPRLVLLPLVFTSCDQLTDQP